MKKVLVWETSPSVSGGQKMTLTVMDALKDVCSFCCLIPGKGSLAEELEHRGIPYVLIGDQTLPAGTKGFDTYFRYAWMSVRSILRSMGEIGRFHPDILYAPGPAALPWSAVCGSLAKIPVVWHLHHLFLDGPTKKLLNIVSRWKSVKTILAVSNVVGDQITIPQAREKVKCLYNPIDISQYAHGNKDKAMAQIREQMGYDIQPELILMEVALIRRSKRQDLFLQVVQALRRQGVSAFGVLVGGPITEDDCCFEKELHQKIRSYGLSKHICMTGRQDNVADYLAAADCIFVPSREGLPLVMLEAMAAKCQVIATEIGGAGELLEAAGCGFCYPDDASAEQIAQTVLRAVTDSSDRIEKGYAFCLSHGPDWYQESLRTIFLRDGT